MPRKENESITQTQCRMYSEQKTKSSTNLIPDESSLMEHVKQATIIWKQCLDQNIEIPSLDVIEVGIESKEDDGQIEFRFYLNNYLHVI